MSATERSVGVQGELMQDMSIDVFARSRVDRLYTRHAPDMSNEELDQAKLRLQHEDPETL